MLVHPKKNLRQRRRQKRWRGRQTETRTRSRGKPPVPGTRGQPKKNHIIMTPGWRAPEQSMCSTLCVCVLLWSGVHDMTDCSFCGFLLVCYWFNTRDAWLISGVRRNIPAHRKDWREYGKGRGKDSTSWLQSRGKYNKGSHSACGEKRAHAHNMNNCSFPARCCNYLCVGEVSGRYEAIRSCFQCDFMWAKVWKVNFKT